MLPTKAVLPSLPDSWNAYLKEEQAAPYFKELQQRLEAEIDRGYDIFPPQSQIFNAFEQTALEEVRVVILGQDPYHGPKQANGLAFSVNEGIKQPPSLQNIFKEIQLELGGSLPQNGDLTPWAKQGVLLLNTVLTVRAGQAGSHRNIGWENFTSSTLRLLSKRREGLVFLLWGKDAQGKAELIDKDKHFILKAPHPSPYSANKGFFGCEHFKQTNEILKSIGKTPITWDLSQHEA